MRSTTSSGSSPISGRFTETGFIGDDAAIVCGGAFLNGRPLMVVGEQKGRDTKQKLYRNFGMPKPEGYRKALRVMQMAVEIRTPDRHPHGYARRLSRH